jgi:bacterioferritin (cytochrome b1)
MKTHLLEDLETVWITIPLDGESAERLKNLADACHAAPDRVAASLLHDVLKDDEEANLPAAMHAGDLILN